MQQKTQHQPPPRIPKKPKRRGPEPLALHLALAGRMWLNWPELWLRLRHKSPGSSGNWNEKLSQRAASLQNSAAKLNPDRLAAALALEGINRYRHYLDGVTAYCRQDGTRDLPDCSIIAQEGTTKLLDYGCKNAAPIVLVIPSFINRYHVLDLDQDRSFLRWLRDQGIRPILVDWAVPGKIEAGMTVADYVARLQKMLQHARQIAGGEKIHLLGHCIGGTLALALAAANPDAFRSIILLSTPWDFHRGNTALGKNAAELWKNIAPNWPQHEPIPASFIQALFTVLQPAEVTEKFRKLGMNPQRDPAKMRRFTLVEDWLNDGVPVVRAVAAEIIEDWYGANLPGKGKWRVGDIAVKPRKIRAPVLVAVPDHDRIVPPASAAALAGQLPNAQEWHVPLGHIGMIVSGRARKLVWQPVADWIKNHHKDTAA
ncbi:MAG: alpha/beta fold hydrolase [Alphaproteobacteria bacterium]